MLFTVQLTERLTPVHTGYKPKEQCYPLHVGSGAGFRSSAWACGAKRVGCCAVGVDSTRTQSGYVSCVVAQILLEFSQKMGHRATINMCFHQREMFQRGFVRIQLIFELKMHQFINAFHQIQHSWYMSRLVSTGVAEDCVCTRWMNAAACCVYTVSNPARASFIQKTISISLQHIFPLSPRRLFSLR